MSWEKTLSCPEQHLQPLLHPTQLTEQRLWLEISLRVKEVPETTFLYNYTFCFYFQSILPLIFYMWLYWCCIPCSTTGCTPTHPGCTKLGLCFPFCAHWAIAEGKWEFQSGHRESTHLPHTETKPFTTGAAELLQDAGLVMEGWAAPSFPKQPELYPDIPLSSDKAYLNGRRCRMLIPILWWSSSQPKDQQRIRMQPWPNALKLLVFRLMQKRSKCFCFSWCKRALADPVLEVSFNSLDIHKLWSKVFSRPFSTWANFFRHSAPYLSTKGKIPRWGA